MYVENQPKHSPLRLMHTVDDFFGSANSL